MLMEIASLSLLFTLLLLLLLLLLLALLTSPSLLSPAAGLTVAGSLRQRT